MDYRDERGEDVTEANQEDAGAPQHAEPAGSQRDEHSGTNEPATPDQVEAPATGDVSEPDAGQLPGGLRSGDRVGPYAVVRLLRASADEAAYYARMVEEGQDSPLLLMLERPSGRFGSAASLARFELHHPRLLAPRDFIQRAGRDYLVLETLVELNDVPARSVADGASLSYSATLSAGTGLADALAYLHRNEVAHLHVSPDAIYVHEGRAYLAGMEDASYLDTDGDMDRAALFSRDANFLARALGRLAGMENEALALPAAEHDQAARAITEIAAQGRAGTFTSVEEVAAVCAGSLQSGPALHLEKEPGPERLAFLAASATTIGRVRSENQDACAVMQLDVHDDVAQAMPLGVFLVADGMGGEARGELASRIAARSTVAELAAQLAYQQQTDVAAAALDMTPNDTQADDVSTLVQVALIRAVEESNRRVRALAMHIGQTTGTTLTAMAALGGYAAVAHVGDSRAYLLRGGKLHLLTEDHSILARLQAIDHPVLSDPEVFVPRNMLYRSLGQEDDARPDIAALALFPEDRLLICSDGLWDEIDDDTIARMVSTAATPREAAVALVNAANDAGGNDNSTAVVVFVSTMPDVEAVHRAAGKAAPSGDVSAPEDA